MRNEKRKKRKRERKREKERELHARQEEHPERKSSRVREVVHKKNRGGRTYLIDITHEPSVDHGRASAGTCRVGDSKSSRPELMEISRCRRKLPIVNIFETSPSDPSSNTVKHDNTASCLASNWLPVAGSGGEDINEGMITLMLKVNRRKVVLTSEYFPQTGYADQHIENDEDVH